MTTITQRQEVLLGQLVQAIRGALPVTERVAEALESSGPAYRTVAELLVALRQECRAADGTPDLRGRSRRYRTIVRRAYGRAGAPGDGPIEKRLTAGVAYWVRKVLIEQYGEERLRDLGILPVGSFATVSPSGFMLPHEVEDPAECLVTLVDLLNRLATASDFVPAPDIVRSAARAVLLLQRKLAGARRVTAA